MNVLMIAVAPLRVDHLSCYGYARSTTPNIDRLAEAGTLFEQVYSTSPWTPPAYASLMTGLYPATHGVRGDTGLNPQAATLAERLHEAGYRSAAFVTSPHLGGHRGFDRGFGECHEMWRGFRQRHRTVARLGGSLARPLRFVKRLARRLGTVDKGAAATTEQAMRWMERRREQADPFLLLLNYQELHLPYSAPRSIRRRFVSRSQPGVDRARVRRINNGPFAYRTEDNGATAADLDALRELYDAQLFYVDRCLGRLFEHLHATGLAANTLVVLVSLHGECIGEHGRGGNSADLYEELVRSSLILHAPDRVPAGHRVGGLAQLTDVCPTVLDLLGLDARLPAGHGASLLPLSRDRTAREFAFAEWEGSETFGKALEWHTPRMRLFRKAQDKYIETDDGARLLFDLGKDPGETTSLLPQRAARASVLAAEMNRWLEGLEAGKGTPEADLERELLEKLRASGYKL